MKNSQKKFSPIKSKQISQVSKCLKINGFQSFQLQNFFTFLLLKKKISFEKFFMKKSAKKTKED